MLLSAPVASSLFLACCFVALRYTMAVRARGPRWWKLSLTVDHTTLLSNEILSNSLSDHGLPAAVQPLLRRKQRRLIRHNAGALVAVADGARMAVRECRRQFTDRRWDCGQSKYKSRKRRAKKSSLYGKIVSIPCRETAFVYSLTAAAVTHAVTRACTDGSIRTCSCDYKAANIKVSGHRPQSQNRYNYQSIQQESNELAVKASTEAVWEWRGCSEDVAFGYRFARAFGDAGEKARHLRSIMNLHNSEAGRRHVQSLLRLKCKCHGMSGSCTLKSCWWRLAPFSQVGKVLKSHFDSASEVVATPFVISRLNDRRSRRRGRMRRRNVAREAFRPAQARLKFPGKRDLIFFAQSPNFCTSNKTLALAGTSGRICNVSSRGMDGCSLMCCGRGYKTRVVAVKERCKCTFKWCCEVKCKTCYTKKTIHTCR